jgi:hypothetical protein
VAHRLEVPHHLAALAPESHHGAAVVVDGAIAAEVVGGGVAGGDEEQTALLVDRHGRPDVGGAQRELPVCLVTTARVPVEVRRRQIPRPALLPAAGVEASEHPAGCVDCMVVRDGRPDRDDVAHDGRGGRHLVLALPVDGSHATRQIDLAGLAERRAGPTAACIEGDQPRVVGGREDALAAAARGRRVGVAPERDAPTDELIGVAAVQGDLRVVAPAFLSGVGIEGDHAVEGSAEVERPVHQDGRRLERSGGAYVSLAVGDVAGAIAPGHLELVHVGRRDVPERRVAAAPGIVAVGGPLGGAGDRLRRLAQVLGRPRAGRPQRRVADQAQQRSHGADPVRHGCFRSGHRSSFTRARWVKSAIVSAAVSSS